MIQRSYSAFEGYKILNSHIEKYLNEWSWIWKSKVPQRIKYFLWKIKNGIIPCNSFLASRGMLLDTSCSWRRHSQENLNLLFWSFPLANTLWSILIQWININMIHMPSNQFNVSYLLSLNFGKDITRYRYFFAASCLWSILKVRNDCTFKF